MINEYDLYLEQKLFNEDGRVTPFGKKFITDSFSAKWRPANSPGIEAIELVNLDGEVVRKFSLTSGTMEHPKSKEPDEENRRREIREAVLHEREYCAQIADTQPRCIYGDQDVGGACYEIARKIRDQS